MRSGVVALGVSVGLARAKGLGRMAGRPAGMGVDGSARLALRAGVLDDVDGSGSSGTLSDGVELRPGLGGVVVCARDDAVCCGALVEDIADAGLDAESEGMSGGVEVACCCVVGRGKDPKRFSGSIDEALSDTGWSLPELSWTDRA
jgi:hypothetical protein